MFDSISKLRLATFVAAAAMAAASSAQAAVLFVNIDDTVVTANRG
jgi:outer membrane cobalamin receptor